MFATWEAAGQRAIQARASTDAARLRGDAARVRALEQTATRWQNVQQGLVSLTPLLAAEYNSDSIAYQEQLRWDAYLAYERQQAAMQTADGFGKKENSYTAVISSLAVVLFLMGLSLTMNNWLRYVFVGGGILIAVASAVWVVVVTVRPVAVTSEEAMEYFVDGLVASNRSDSAADTDEADRLEEEAIGAFDAAVDQHELYANAYLWRGYTRLENRLRFADADRNAIAAEDINRAIELGIINSVSHTNLSWAHILAGNYAGAVEAAGAALTLNPNECVAHFNLGWSHLALNQSLKAAEAYDAALGCTANQSTNNQNWLFNAGIVDLHDMAAVLPKQDNMEIALERIKEASASMVLLGQPIPKSLSATVSGVRFSSDVSEDNQPIGAANRFASGTNTVYTFFQFDGIESDTPWLVRWYRDGELYDWFVDTDWPYDIAGQTWVSVAGSPLPAGDYVAEVFIGGNLLAAGDFHVEAGQALVLEHFESEFFGVALDHPIGWTPVEEATDDGYLYLAPALDDTRFLLYFKNSWQESSQSLLDAGMEIWEQSYPDIQYGSPIDRSLFNIEGGLAVPASYTNEGNVSVKALLIAAAADGRGHFLVMQSPAAEFERDFETLFEPMLLSLKLGS